MQAQSPARHSATFLDALGTLIRLEEPWPALCARLRERHGAAIALADARRALLAEMAHYRRNCVFAGDRDALYALRLECAAIVRSELAPTLDALSVEELAPTLLDALHFEPFPDAVPTLRRLRAAGRRLVVVSNWDVSLHDVLDATGLAPLLDGVVCSAQVGTSKPDPAIFEAALGLAGAAAAQAVHVGDSLAEDVAGARAAGIEAVLLVRGADAPRPPAGVRTVASLREL